MADKPKATPLAFSPIRLLTPLVFWLALIYVLSGYEKTLIPQSKYISWDKIAHIIEYSILGYLIARAAYFSGIRWVYLSYFWVTLSFGVLYAASDEWHQLHVPGRYASPFDVLADAVGILLGLYIFSRGFRKTSSP